jgi:hypothetical protein
MLPSIEEIREGTGQMLRLSIGDIRFRLGTGQGPVR